MLPWLSYGRVEHPCSTAAQAGTALRAVRSRTEIRTSIGSTAGSESPALPKTPANHPVSGFPLSVRPRWAQPHLANGNRPLPRRLAAPRCLILARPPSRDFLNSPGKEGWQSGRLRLIRNQMNRKVPGVRIPSPPPEAFSKSHNPSKSEWACCGNVGTLPV